MTEYGSGGSFTVSMDGPFAGSGASTLKMVPITAPAADWKGGTSPYSQVVEVDGISINSMVHIQMSKEMAEQLQGKDISFTTENDEGTVTLFAIGEKPDIDCEFQATLLEVIAT